MASLEERRRQLKAQYDAMPKVVTANGVAHTRIMQMEKEFDAAAVQVKEQQDRVDEAKKLAQEAVASSCAAFRQELITFFDDLKTKNRFREILALTNCYTTVMGQDAGIASLGQEALENERAYRESVRIVDAVLAKVTPLTVRGEFSEAIVELERSTALIESKLRDEHVKNFTLTRLGKERGQLAGKLAVVQEQQAANTNSMQQKRAARFATITASIENDPWESERMLPGWPATRETPMT